VRERRRASRKETILFLGAWAGLCLIAFEFTEGLWDLAGMIAAAAAIRIAWRVARSA
jgi:hypothetical protein